MGYNRTNIDKLTPSILSPSDARQIFNLRQAKDVLWAYIDNIPAPQYLSDNIDRMLTVSSEASRTSGAFRKRILDQILIAVAYEHKQTQTAKQRASSQPENPAVLVLDLQQQTHFQRQVIYGGKTRLLDGYADYTIGYESQEKESSTTLSTTANLIIIRAKNSDSTDTCLGELAAYMGIAHASRKDEQKQSSSMIYGAAFDGLSFRVCRIDNEGNWSRSHLIEWKKMNDTDGIYSIFKFLIRIARPSTPSVFYETSFRTRQGERAYWDNMERGWGCGGGGKFTLCFSGLELEEELELEVEEEEEEEQENSERLSVDERT